MPDFLRWTTVHPALVNFVVGTMPLMILAYALGAIRKSPRWTFVGDVTLWVTTVLATIAGAFGLVAFLTVEWPGGLETWKWLHLGLGVSSAVLLIVFSLFRARRRRESEYNYRPAVYLAVAAGAAILLTGWVGGEVLVFRGGIAVEAAGHGALAPPITAPLREPPDSVGDAMKRIRGHWAKSTTTVAYMLVEKPSSGGFEIVAREAEHLARLGRWLAEVNHSQGPDNEQGSPEAKIGLPFVSAAHASPAPVEHGQAEGVSATAEAKSDSEAQVMATLGARLADQAEELRTAARDRNLVGVADTLGAITATCTRCHTETRWNGHER